MENNSGELVDLAKKFKEVRPAVFRLDAEDGRAPVQIYATKKLFETLSKDRTIKQAVNVAKLPGIIERSMVMPDAHEGYGFPIGGVAAFDAKDGIISPGGIGFDINCGVRTLVTNLTEEDVKPKIKLLIERLFDNVPCGEGRKGAIRLSQEELDKVLAKGSEWCLEKGYAVKEDLERTEEYGRMKNADPSKVSDLAKQRGAPQLGTLGGGNHFLEVQKVDKIFDERVAKAFGIEREGQVVVMIHCGSRGFGHQVASDYLKKMLEWSHRNNITLADKELAYAPIQSQEGQDYLKANACGINFAFANRQLIAHFVRKSFQEAFGKPWQEFGLNMVYDVCHNIAKFEKHEVNGVERDLCVHRKGATRAFWPGRVELPDCYKEVGHPVLIPGSMGTASYILVGTEGAKETWGSVCHGSGRVKSRHKAILDNPFENVTKDLNQLGVVFKVANLKEIGEEAANAYKNVDDVIESVVESGIARKVVRVTPLGVIKG